MDELITRKTKEVVEFVETLKELFSIIEDTLENSKPSLNGERYLTDKELSEKLKLSRRTLQEYRSQGIISYVQLGGKILYKESDIEKLLLSNYFKSWKNSKEI